MDLTSPLALEPSPFIRRMGRRVEKHRWEIFMDQTWPGDTLHLFTVFPLWYTQLQGRLGYVVFCIGSNMPTKNWSLDPKKHGEDDCWV